MYFRRSRPVWGWGVGVRIPGCATQALAGALVLGVMILLALLISAFQVMQSVLLR